jgi:hypothetical protein
MKKLRIFLTGLLTGGLLLLPAGTVFAQENVLDPACQVNPSATLCKDNSQTKNQTTTSNKLYGPSGILTRIAQIIAIIAGMAGVIMIVIGGLRYVMAAGDANAINTAKNTILFAIVGLVIAAIAQGIVLFVLSRL